MPLYEYKAYSSKGKQSRGLIDAPSRSSAREILKRRGELPISLVEEKDAGRRGGTSRVDDLIFSLRQLSVLLRAGLPLTAALDSISAQVENEQLKRAYTRVRSQIVEGSTLAGALALDRVFPPLLIVLVEAGEQVGAVEEILEKFADFIEKESEFQRKVMAALIYPSVILLACLGLVFFIITYIAPTLMEIFTAFKKTLPLSTSILLFVGNVFRKYWPLILILVAGGVVAWKKLVPLHYKDRMKLNLPLLGQTFRYIMFSRWARTLSMLHGGGVSLTTALGASREVVGNIVVYEALATVQQDVEKGVSLAAALKKIPYVPSFLVQMSETGEKSGELEKMLETTANFFERTTERKLGIFLQLLEPAIILFLGVVVGFVVISVLLPIFELNKLIH